MKKRFAYLLMTAMIICTLLVPVVAHAAYAGQDFSFPYISAATSGTNYTSYGKGTCYATAQGKTYNMNKVLVTNPSPVQKFEVELRKTLGYSFGLYTADGVSRQKSTTLPKAQTYYPRVYKNTAGSYLLNGTGYTSQTY